jgi:hypothetical protein
LLTLPLKIANSQGAEIKPEMKISGSQIIRVSTAEFQIRERTVDSGTVVIWANTSPRSMEIEFTGKQVVMACESPTGFYVNDKGSFISSKLPPKAVASLCFIEKGEYDYEVKLRSFGALGTGGGTQFHKGKIIVK